MLSCGLLNMGFVSEEGKAFFFLLTLTDFIPQTNLPFWWATFPTYHRQLRATSSPPLNSSALKQTCWGKTRETSFTEVNDVTKWLLFLSRRCFNWKSCFLLLTRHNVIGTQICLLCLFAVNLMNSEYLEGVLPDCSYKPSYIIKDFPLMRYQGLQFVCIFI